MIRLKYSCFWHFAVCIWHCYGRSCVCCADVLPALRRRRVLVRLQGEQGLRHQRLDTHPVQVLPLSEVPSSWHVPTRYQPTCLLLQSTIPTARPLQGSRGYPRGYIKGFISSQNSPLFSGSTFNIPSRCGGICRNLSGVKVWLTLHKLIWSFRQQRAIYTLIALLQSYDFFLSIIRWYDWLKFIPS